MEGKLAEAQKDIGDAALVGHLYGAEQAKEEMRRSILCKIPAGELSDLRAKVQKWEASAALTNDALRFEHNLMLTWKDKATELEAAMGAKCREIDEAWDERDALKAKLEEAERELSEWVRYMGSDCTPKALSEVIDEDAKTMFSLKIGKERAEAQAAALAEALEKQPCVGMIPPVTCLDRAEPNPEFFCIRCRAIYTYREGR